MLSLRTHIIITAAIFAAIIVLAMLGNALQASGAGGESPGLRIASIIVFFTLCIGLMFSAVPVMVKLVLGFQVAIGNAAQPAIAGLLRRERLIVFTLWALIALGLVIAIPAAIINGAFD